MNDNQIGLNLPVRSRETDGRCFPKQIPGRSRQGQNIHAAVSEHPASCLSHPWLVKASTSDVLRVFGIGHRHVACRMFQGDTAGWLQFEAHGWSISGWIPSVAVNTALPRLTARLPVSSSARGQQQQSYLKHAGALKRNLIFTARQPCFCLPRVRKTKPVVSFHRERPKSLASCLPVKYATVLELTRATRITLHKISIKCPQQSLPALHLIVLSVLIESLVEPHRQRPPP